MNFNNNNGFDDISGTLNNAGTIQVTANNVRVSGGTINNTGTFTTGNTITFFNGNTTFNNTGTLDFAGDGDFVNTGGILSIVNAGTIVKTSGVGDSVLSSSGGNSIALSGNGIIDAQTGFISIAGNTSYANNFTVTGGTGPNSLRINSGIQTFGLGSSFNNGTYLFGSGEIAGELTIASDATLNFNNNNGFDDISGTLNNAGIVQISADNVRIAGGTFNNLVGGTLEFTNDTDLTTFGTAPVLTNAGTILKSSGTGVSTISGTVTFSNNNGVLDAQSGTLQVPSSVSSTGYILQGNGTIDLQGTTAPITDIRPGGSSGILNITGDIDIDPTTVFSVEIGGPAPGLTAADHDQLVVSGIMNFNNGIIDVSFLNNYDTQLVEGQVFTIATYGMSTGFVGDLGINRPANIGFRLNDTGTSLQLIVDSSFVNNPPIAGDDAYIVNTGVATTFDVFNNDFDLDNQTISLFDFTQPANGTVSLDQAGNLVYISNQGFSGQDSFTYRITDRNGGIDIATVVVDVLPSENVSVRGDSAGSQTDVIQGTLVSFTQGMNGTVTDNGDGTYTYQANIGFRGTDSFTVTTMINGINVDRVVDVNIFNNVVLQTWTGQAGDGDWSNPDNWNLGLTPADGDSITIPDGVDVITFTSGNVTLQTLALSDTLIVQSGTINVMGDATILNNGVLDIAAGQTFVVNGGDFINNGTIFGKGTLDVTQATSFINNGILSPGNSPGSLTINGDFTQTSSGTIVLEIAGLVPGTQYDQLIINGTATLNGTVNIVLLNGFVLPANGNFQLISATTFIGSPIINTPAGVTFDLFTGNTTSTPLGGFTGTGTFTFGPTGSGGAGGFISISGPSFNYDPIQVARSGSTVTPIVYRTVTDTEWTGVIDDLTVALVDDGTSNDDLVAEFEALLKSDPTAAGETLSEYELRLEQQLELAVSQFSKEQLAVLDILLQTPDTLSCR